MRRYHQLIAVIGVLLFFSSADLYFFLADYTPTTPRDWITLLGVLLVPVAAHRLYCHDVFGKPLGRLVTWSLVYLSLSIVWYTVLPSDAAVQELRDRLLSVSFLCLTGFAFVSPDSRRVAALAAIVVVVAMVGVNAVELARPDWFYMEVSTRASGLYGNANQCGAAMVIGMTIGSPLVPRRLRLLFYLLVGTGVAMTFSRSTTLGWMIASAVMLAFDSTSARARELIGGGLAAMVLALVLLRGAAAFGMVDGTSLDDNLFDRVSFFRTFEASDDATLQRKEVAARAWGMFAASPLEGNGLASTVQWSEPTSTHDMYLSLMADHGILGAFILPALLLCVFLGRPTVGQGPHCAFCLFVLWYAFFSHNLLTERYQLLAFAFFAAGGTIEADALRAMLREGSESESSAAGDVFQDAIGAR